jgi:hypothetical protein
MIMTNNKHNPRLLDTCSNAMLRVFSEKMPSLMWVSLADAVA